MPMSENRSLWVPHHQIAGRTKTPCHWSRLHPQLRRCLICCQWRGNSAGGHADPQRPLCEAQFRIARRARSTFPTHLTADTLNFVRAGIHRCLRTTHKCSCRNPRPTTRSGCQYSRPLPLFSHEHKHRKYSETICGRQNQ